MSDIEAVAVACHICGRRPRPGLQWWRRTPWWEASRGDDLCLRCGRLPVGEAFNLLARRLRAELDSHAYLAMPGCTECETER